MSYRKAYEIVMQGGTVTQRMTVAVAMAAQKVFVEPEDTEFHAARLAWARKAIAAPEAMGKAMIWGVAVTSKVLAARDDATDEDIQQAVDGLVNQFLLA